MSDDDTNLFDFAWGKLIGGAILLWVAYWMHGVFTELETGARESARMNWILVVLYESLGHQIAVGLVGVAGAAALVFGVRQLVTERQ